MYEANYFNIPIKYLYLHKNSVDYLNGSSEGWSGVEWSGVEYVTLKFYNAMLVACLFSVSLSAVGFGVILTTCTNHCICILYSLHLYYLSPTLALALFLRVPYLSVCEN